MIELKKLIPTFVALAVVLLTSKLGFWQLDRAHEREAQAVRRNKLHFAQPIALGPELVNAAQVLDYPAQASGHWISEKMIWLDNRIYQGQAGYEVLMPLRITGTNSYIIVNRGWIHATDSRKVLPAFKTGHDLQTVEGIIHQRTPRVAYMGKAAREGAVWSELEPGAYAAWSGLRVQPVILYQTNNVPDGLVRDWPKAGSGADRNRGYAIQWFSMALTTFSIWAYYLLRRKRQNTREIRVA
ncbi:MAG: SURF1 family protein [Rugosibacter sp.]